MKPEHVLDVISVWTSLRFFPSDPAGRLGIAKLVAAMCADLDQVRWLSDRLLFLFDDWPGPRTLRMVYCQRWKPADGIDLRGFCQQYPDGFPSLKPVEAPSLPKLPPGKPEPLVLDAMKQSPTLPEPLPVDWKRAQEFGEILEETLTAPEDRPKAKLPRAQKQSEIVRLADDPASDPRPDGTYKRITQTDIDEAVKQLHNERTDTIH